MIKDIEYNYKITIDKIDGYWWCILTKYDSLPFGNYKNEIVKTLKSKTYSQLMVDVTQNGIFELIDKNE